MSIKFCAITPHPPIIIPEVGKENLPAAKKTILAMEKLGEEFAKAEIETAIIISPHAQLLSKSMVIFAPEKFVGDFSEFGAEKVSFEFGADDLLAEKIVNNCHDKEIPIEYITKKILLDHGAMVPLYYLTKNITRPIKIIEIGFSTLSKVQHQEFGRAIAEVTEKSNERVAIIASGDMSHRIFDNYYSDYGKKFDKKIVDIIKLSNFEKIIDIDDELIELAGECGYRSLLIISGILFEKKYIAKLFSYEAPFGVGYLMAEIEIKK